MELIKKLVKKIFNLTGFEISRKFDEREIKTLTFDEIYKRKITNQSPIIFDIGANKGQSINRFLNLNNNPIIHAFEPNIDEFNILKNKFHSVSNVKLNNFGIGNEKTKKKFFKAKHSGNSSFVPIKKNTKWIKLRSEQLGIEQKNYYEEGSNVMLETVDTYCSSHSINHIDIMKVDTQLFEEEVLIGSKKMLESQKIDAIELEIVFSDAYEKYYSFSDLEKYLIPNNYRFAAIKLNNNNIFSGSIFFADILFLNKKKFNL